MEALHLYCVLGNGVEVDSGLIGLDGRQVSGVCHRGLTALVSLTPIRAYKSMKKEEVIPYLFAHQAVLEQVMKRQTVVPVKFGTMARDEARVRRILESGGTVSASAIWQLPFVMGCPDIDSALEKARAFTLEGVAEKIRMPILIMNGEEDAIVPIRMAQRLFEACGSADKELKIFGVQNGGSQHCLFDNLPLASNYIADWWEDRLRGKT